MALAGGLRGASRTGHLEASPGATDAVHTGRPGHRARRRRVEPVRVGRDACALVGGAAVHLTFEPSPFFQERDDPGGTVADGGVGGLEHQFGGLRRFVGCVDSRELGNLAGARLLVESFRVARLADLDRRIHEDFHETVAADNFARLRAVFAVRGNERG